MMLIACGRPVQTQSKQDALGLLAAGDTASAIRRIEKINLKRNRDPALYVLLGSLYRDLGTINGRLLSQRLLERGLSVLPNDPDLLTELGKTYFAQTFYPDAKRCFRAALDADPHRCEAHYYIGLYYYNNWKRANQYTDDLTAARRHLAAAVQCDSTDVPSTIRLAFSLYALDRRSEASDVCQKAIDRFSDAPEFYMLRGAMAFDDKRFDEAASDFLLGIERMDDEIRREYVDLFSLLTYNERFLYKQSHVDKRATIERGYWIDVDPDPTTSINERRLEHVYRVFIADLYYSRYRPPTRGWKTERGATVVKFGWPWHIQSTLAGSQFDGRREEWHYIHNNRLRRFVFVDEYLNGNLRIPIEADSMVVVLRYSPRKSDYKPEAVAIPGTMDVTAFKDDEFSSTFYVSAAVNAAALQEVVDLAKVNHFRFRGVFFDENWNVDKRFEDELWTSQVDAARVGQTVTYYLNRPISLPFDSYRIACAFEDEYSLARTLLKGGGNSIRFAEPGLTVSDVMLQKDKDRTAGSIERNGHRLYPNPSRVYSDGQRLVVYFEIYNLRMTRRRTDFDVTFHIFHAPEDKPSRWRELGRRIAGIAGFDQDRDPAISQTIHRQGGSFTSEEDMSINIDALGNGRYDLVISIDDRISGEHAYSSSIFVKR
jgi:GWxTD domain-containing protein